MAKRDNVDIFIGLPWWFNLLLGGLGYAVAKFVIPNIPTDNPFLNGVVVASPHLAAPIFILFAFFAVISALHAWRRGDLLESQTSLTSVRDLSWKDFEFLVSEAFRRRGYSVEERLSSGPDGGVDLILRKEARIVLVQCKNWRTRLVGVSTVREVFGIVTAERADGGIVICSGYFTSDAIAFAQGKNIELIDGDELTGMIGRVQKRGKVAKAPSAVYCPRCKGLMVLRTAKRGRYAGRKFWGCSRYPKCRGTRKADA